MSKKKRKIRTPEGEWESFVTKMLARKRDKRDFALPMDYLGAIADSIHKTNPSQDILLNTLVDVAGVVGEKFYLRAMADSKSFRDKQESHRKEDWKKELTQLDDRIHNKISK
jgi:hypothetical protein